MKAKRTTRNALAAVLLLICLGIFGCKGDGPVVGPGQCIPCGDFIIQCDLTDLGCPVCYTLDFNSGEIEMCYSGAGCMKMDTVAGSMAFYEDDGTECYSAVFDQSTGDVTYTLDGDEYTAHEDETWTCPDGTTWILPEACQGDETVENPFDPEDEGDPACPNIMTLPPCE